MALRWGIASAGKISHDFVCALRVLPREHHQIIAVSARSNDSAQKFAREHGIDESYPGYEALAKHPDIDIVYIGVINTLHYSVAKLMIENGKHVLCEKPLTMNAKQSKALLSLAKSKGVFFMEAIWSRCFPVYKKLQEILHTNALGDVKHVSVNFGFPLTSVGRVNVKEMGGGGILDIGVYTLQFVQFVFRNLKVQKFTGSGFLNDYAVDKFASCIIEYEGNRTAVLTISTEIQLPNEAIIVGTNGSIKIPSFWAPTQLVMPDNEIVEFPLPETKDKFNFNNSVGLNYEAEECRKCISQGLKESLAMTHNESLGLAELMDAWRKAVGVSYAVDN